MTKTVKNGDKVKVHYTGRFEDGKVFDSSVDREPLDVEVGAAQVIKGFEDALVGMQEKERKTITVSPPPPRPKGETISGETPDEIADKLFEKLRENQII